jgi:hypothetical protein
MTEKEVYTIDLRENERFYLYHRTDSEPPIEFLVIRKDATLRISTSGEYGIVEEKTLRKAGKSYSPILERLKSRKPLETKMIDMLEQLREHQ